MMLAGKLETACEARQMQVLARRCGLEALT